MNNRIKLLIAVSITLMLSGCFLSGKSDSHNDSNGGSGMDATQWFIIWFELCAGPGDETTTATAKDNHDGTIAYVETTHYKQNADFCPKSHDSKTVLYKKCLQGQLYRQEQDDCKGTGSADDYYGAKKFQYCETDGIDDCVLSYTDSIEPDPETSPAYRSCLNDNFANKSWKLPNKMSESETENGLSSQYSTRPEEIPYIGETFWGYAASNQGARAYTINDNSITYSDYAKTDYKYIICSTNFNN